MDSTTKENIVLLLSCILQNVVQQQDAVGKTWFDETPETRIFSYYSVYCNECSSHSDWFILWKVGTGLCFERQDSEVFQLQYWVSCSLSYLHWQTYSGWRGPRKLSFDSSYYPNKCDACNQVLWRRVLSQCLLFANWRSFCRWTELSRIGVPEGYQLLIVCIMGRLSEVPQWTLYAC